VSPVIPTTEYVNIGEFPLKGLNELVNKVKNIPGVTVPDTEAFTVDDEIVNVFPEDKLEFDTIKLGFIVYAEVV